MGGLLEVIIRQPVESEISIAKVGQPLRYTGGLRHQSQTRCCSTSLPAAVGTITHAEAFAVRVEVAHCEDMKGALLEGQGCLAKQQLQCSILGGQQRLANIQFRGTKRRKSTQKGLSTMAIVAEPLVGETNTSTQRPDRDGRFGRFGGKYVRLSVRKSVK